MQPLKVFVMSLVVAKIYKKIEDKESDKLAKDAKKLAKDERLVFTDELINFFIFSPLKSDIKWLY